MESEFVQCLDDHDTHPLADGRTGPAQPGLARPRPFGRGVGSCVTAVMMLVAAARPLTAQDVAARAWHSGDLQTAERLYRERLAADSTDARALHRLALLEAWKGDYAAGIELFDLLLRHSPGNDDAAVDRARVLAWQGDLTEALEAIDRVLQQKPGYVPALEARALFQSWAGDYEGALSLYEHLDDIVPRDRTFARERARVLSWASRLDAAIAVYDSLLTVDPADRDARLGLARTLSWAANVDSAAAIYRSMLAADSADLDAVQGLARIAGWRGDLVQSEAGWRDAVDLDPENITSLMGLAETLSWQGRTAAANAVMQRASALHPSNHELRAQYARIRAPLAPRASASFKYETDSDGNRLATVATVVGWRPQPRVELQMSAYARTLDVASLAWLDQTAYGAYIDARSQLEPGWDLEAGVGLSASDVGNNASIGRVRLGLATPRRHRIGGSLSYRHEPLDYTALLVLNRVVMDEGELTVRVTPANGWNARLGISLARFVGYETNNRAAGFAWLTRDLSPSFTVGASFRAYGFTSDANDGYFDPNLYVLGEVNARWSTTLSRVRLLVELAPSMQHVGGSGTVSAAVRARTTVAYVLAPGREIGLAGGFSTTTGLSTFASGEGDYRYGTVGATMSWAF